MKIVTSGGKKVQKVFCTGIGLIDEPDLGTRAALFFDNGTCHDISYLRLGEYVSFLASMEKQRIVQKSMDKGLSSEEANKKAYAGKLRKWLLRSLSTPAIRLSKIYENEFKGNVGYTVKGSWD